MVMLTKGQMSLVMLNNGRTSLIMLNNGRIQKLRQFFQSFLNLCHRHQAWSMVMLNNGQMFFPQNRTQELRLRNILRQLQSII
jgi:hypothetical protein